MVNVSSLPVSGGISFDLDSQMGVTQLLVSIRASEVASDDKNDIRDLVFQYTNGGKDVTVRRALEQKIISLGITPVAPKVTATPLPPPPMIGTFRMAPAFIPPSAIHTAPVVAAPAPVVTPKPVIVPAVEKSAPVMEQPVPVQEPEPEPVIVVAPTPVEPVVVASPAPEPIPVSVPVEDNQVYLNRIREIKSIVNERVGNPVNLVDIDNAVGREYMSALLDAMKKLNSGTSPVPAMRRLELAFTAVEATLEKHDTQAVLEESKPEPVVTEPEPEFSIPVTPAPQVVDEAPIYEPTPLRTPDPIIEPLAPPPPIGAIWQPPVPVSAPASGWNTVPTKTISAPLVHSLAESEPLKTPASLPVTRATENPTLSGDVLHTEEVNQGLEQLLLEWSLFKKSGLFGTGPKGREHPLFKKIADLQIPLLLAGRFEGATQEIKQSITDYMNGWRYEQGIIYEPGELFEHYLRRVIRHILDLQKTKIR